MSKGLMNGLKFFSFALVIAVLMFVGAGQGHAQAAVHQNMRPSTLYCNFRTYSFSSIITFERSTGETVQLETDSLNYTPAVDIWHGSTYQGIYALPAYDGNVGYGYEMEIYSYAGSDWVNICTNWTSI